MKHVPPVALRLDDEASERTRRSLTDAAVALQKIPAAAARIINDVSLVDGVATPIAHGLGRVPKIVLLSPPRGATTTGRTVEVRDGTHDRTKYVTLTATGHGATIQIDIEVK